MLEEMSTVVITAAPHDNNKTLSGSSATIRPQALSMQDESTVRDQCAQVSVSSSMKVISTTVGTSGDCHNNGKYLQNGNNQLQPLAIGSQSENVFGSLNQANTSSVPSTAIVEGQTESFNDYALPQNIMEILKDVAMSGSTSALPWNEPVREARKNAACNTSTTTSDGINITNLRIGKTSQIQSGDLLLTKLDDHYSKSNKNGLLRRHTAALHSTLESGRKRSSVEEDGLLSTQKTKKRILSTHRSQFGIGSDINCLRDAFRVSIGVVLDRFYSKSGYKLSPAETWICTESDQSTTSPTNRQVESTSICDNERDACGYFTRRRNRIMKCLDSRFKIDDDADLAFTNFHDEPPFTLQRIAEVLLTPERYFTRAHKLCNSLEKLLLVSASSSAFGGSFGGYNLQNLREQNEIAALNRHRELNLDSILIASNDKNEVVVESLQKKTSVESTLDENDSLVQDGAERYLSQQSTADIETTPREVAEAKARASLRSKFDHVTVESPIQMATCTLEGEGRVRANSPPPPMCGVASPLTLPGPHCGILRNHSPGPASPTSPDRKDQSPVSTRNMSPLLFGSPNLAAEVSSPPLSSRDSPHHSLLHGSLPLSQTPPFDLGTSRPFFTGSGFASLAGHREFDIESRSPASSDFDSESDVSFDDSASDRSDGSDSGQCNEVSTACRVPVRTCTSTQQTTNSRIVPSSATRQSSGYCDSPSASKQNETEVDLSTMPEVDGIEDKNT